VRRIAVLAGVLALAGPTVFAQEGRPSILRDIGFDQRLGETVPLDLGFRDETGREVRLGDYFGKRPVVLTLNYYGCPMLCTVSLNGLASALNVLTYTAGREFEVVTVSFDARETADLAARKKKSYLERYKRQGAAEGWHFLTGKQASIDALTKAVGFKYAWDTETKQFAHPAGVVVLTPGGKISRYLFGIEYAPKDLRFAVVESSEGRVGNAVDQIVLACYNYDPATGRYGAAIMRIVRVSGALTLLAVGSFVILSLRRERRSAGAPQAKSVHGGVR
jgi:protein SCO1/2